MNFTLARKHRTLSALVIGGIGLAASIGGCTLEPEYRRPDAPVSQHWPDGPAYSSGDAGQRDTPAADIGWREFFTDPRLQKLIELALAHNPDARIAALNVAAARAQYRIQRAELFPTIAATGVEQAEKYPAGLGAAGANGAGISRYYQAGIGFTAYELDVFGRLRSLDHARLQQYLGYVETRRSTQISLVAEVANAYLTLLADEALLRLTRDTLSAQEQAYALIKMSFDGGVASALDLRQAETSVDTARANLAQYTRQAAQAQNALTQLLGTTPADLPAGATLDEQKLLTDLAPGLPSDLLARRPDILAAEHELKAANANIGAARAAFFPSVTLTGSYGTASPQLSGLFDHGSTAWSFMPQISLPIFAGGANAANLDLAKIEKNVDIARYEKVIQTAFREVADALAGRATLDDQIAADRALVEATGESYRLAGMRFRSGVDNYLNVLDAQRSHYAAQQTLVGVQLARLQNLVTLYKAMGGGWNEHGAHANDNENAAAPRQ
jgi:multidrug efflux system outer membrane protein